jgi:hypothetical protein
MTDEPEEVACMLIFGSSRSSNSASDHAPMKKEGALRERHRERERKEVGGSANDNC